MSLSECIAGSRLRPEEIRLRRPERKSRQRYITHSQLIIDQLEAAHPISLSPWLLIRGFWLCGLHQGHFNVACAKLFHEGRIYQAPDGRINLRSFASIRGQKKEGRAA